MVNDLVNHSYAMKLPIKALDTKLNRAFRFVNTWVFLGWGHTLIPQREGTEAVFRTLLYLAACVYLAGLDLFPYNDNYKLEI